MHERQNWAVGRIKDAKSLKRGNDNELRQSGDGSGGVSEVGGGGGGDGGGATVAAVRAAGGRGEGGAAKA